MLKQIDLRHFKCFEMLKLPLCPLTLLSGANASGKSSVLQALVLLHQTMREDEWSLQLKLNGGAIRLGTAADVIDQVHGRRECGIELLDGDRTYGWTFLGERDDMAMKVTCVGVDGVDKPNPIPLQNLLPNPHGRGPLGQRLRGLTYLTAERLGPRETYPLEDPQDVRVVGSRGEHAVSVLHSGRDERVLDGLAIADVPLTRLRQVEARMAWFFPGCGLTVQKNSPRQRCDAGDSYIQRYEFSSPDPHRLWTDAGIADCSGGIVRGQRRPAADRESRGASPSCRTSSNGAIPGRSRVSGRAGHDRNAQRSRVERCPAGRQEPHAEQ